MSARLLSATDRMLERPTPAPRDNGGKFANGNLLAENEINFNTKQHRIYENTLMTGLFFFFF